MGNNFTQRLDYHREKRDDNYLGIVSGDMAHAMFSGDTQAVA